MKNKKILIIDNDSFYKELLGRYLAIDTVDIAFLSDFKEGLALVDQGGVDYVISDTISNTRLLEDSLEELLEILNSH